jgi:phospholipid transport system substrate-binding protein
MLALPSGGMPGWAVVRGAAAGSAVTGFGGPRSRAQTSDPRQPVDELYAALRAAMREGHATPFKQRFDRLAPVIDRTFDLDAILQTSVGLRWPALDEASRQTLVEVFRAFTVASYTANFDTDNGEKLEVRPQTRAAESEVVVETSLVPAQGDPVRIDYVMRQEQGSPVGWRIVDVLLDGSISRVAVQRSDFRSLLASGSPVPLIDSLKRKVAELSGGTMRL